MYVVQLGILIIDAYSKGLNQVEISQKLSIPRSTVGADLGVLRRQCKTNVDTFINEHLPMEYESLKIGVTKLLKHSWEILEDENSSDKMVSVSIQSILSCYNFKRQLLESFTNMPSYNISEFIEEQNRQHPYLMESGNSSQAPPNAIESGREGNPEAIF